MDMKPILEDIQNDTTQLIALLSDDQNMSNTTIDDNTHTSDNISHPSTYHQT